MKKFKIVMLISGGAALLNLGLTQLNAPVVAHASESSNVSTWAGTTLAEPTQSVIMGGQTFYVVRTASQLAYCAVPEAFQITTFS